jgi:hypothetical protein
VQEPLNPTAGTIRGQLHQRGGNVNARFPLLGLGVNLPAHSNTSGCERFAAVMCSSSAFASRWFPISSQPSAAFRCRLSVVSSGFTVRMMAERIVFSRSPHSLQSRFRGRFKGNHEQNISSVTPYGGTWSCSKSIKAGTASFASALCARVICETLHQNQNFSRGRPKYKPPGQKGGTLLLFVASREKRVLIAPPRARARRDCRRQRGL